MARKVEVLLGGGILVSTNPSGLRALATRQTLTDWIFDTVADAAEASVIRARAGN